jgi:polysaccharide biosynthesis transport protein
MADYSTELAELLPEPSNDGSKGIGINLRRLLKMRARYMIAAFVLIVVPAAALVWKTVPPYFTATAHIEFKSTSPQLIEQRFGSGENFNEFRQYMAAQVELIGNYNTISALLQDEAIMALPSMQKAAADANVLGYLRENIEASPQAGSNLVSVSFTTPYREDSIAITNAIAESYLTNAEERRQNIGGQALASLRESEKNFTKRLREQQEDRERLAKELEVALTPAGNDPTNAIVIMTEATRAALATAQGDKIRAETEQTRIQEEITRVQGIFEEHRKDPHKVVLYADVDGRIDGFQEIMLLIESVSQLQAELNTKKQLYQEGASQLRGTEAELAGKRRELRDKRAEIRGQVIESILTALQQDLKVQQLAAQDAKTRIAEYNSELAEQNRLYRDMSFRQEKVRLLERDIALTEENLAETRQQIAAIETNSQAPARTSLAMPANSPEIPSQKERIKFILLACMFGVTMAVSLGIILEVLDQKIRSGQDIAYATDLPVLATIPHAKEERFPRRTDMATIVSSHPNSMTSDQIRQTVARLLHWNRRGQDLRACAIVSPVNGDGKTTLAVNLAIALAQADRKVLLVDVDSRNPQVENAFGLERAPGLSEMLSREHLARDPDRQTEYENLYVLGPGLDNYSLAERLASKEMKDFMEGARRLFDNVIIDTPAALLAAEPKLIAPLVDGVILVAGAGTLSFGKLKRGIRTLEECGAFILGVVINRVRHTAGGYLRENIKAYYRQTGSPRNGGPLTVKAGNGHTKRKREKVLAVSHQEDKDEEL